MSLQAPRGPLRAGALPTGSGGLRGAVTGQPRVANVCRLRAFHKNVWKQPGQRGKMWASRFRSHEEMGPR